MKMELCCKFDSLSLLEDCFSVKSLLLLVSAKYALKIMFCYLYCLFLFLNMLDSMLGILHYSLANNLFLMIVYAFE